MMLGGQAGSRLLSHLYMPTSHDTLLRLIRKWQPVIVSTPHALGVDDWAIRKAKTYGTILVDLHRHRPIDLLEGRTAEGLRDWLKAHGSGQPSWHRSDYRDGGPAGTVRENTRGVLGKAPHKPSK